MNCFTPLLKKVPKAQLLYMPILLGVMLFSIAQTYAGGRPVGKKRLLLIATSAYFFNDQYWDENGAVQSYANNGKYATFNLTLTAEYGFSRRLALLTSLPYYANYFNSTASSTTTSSLGDASVGVSYYIANIAYRTYFSVQSNFLFPVYNNTGSTNYGYGEIGANAKFLASGDFKIGEKPFSYTASVGGTQYFGNQAPLQLSFSGTLGFNITKNNELSFIETTTSSFSSSKTFNPTSAVPAKDFTYSEVTVTFAHNISRNKSIFFSGTRFVAGNNTGVGNRVSLGYAYKF